MAFALSPFDERMLLPRTSILITIMSFDPTKPAYNSPNSSAEMRAQLTALFAEIQARATSADVSNAVSGTSNNSNGVSTLGQTAQESYDQSQMQQGKRHAW